MTEKLFWVDPYRTQLDATVTGVRDVDIRVDRTIFFAFSGGQESDTGTIGGCTVLRARTHGDDIVYTLEDGHGLRTGDIVVMTIDWHRRYRLMRLHLAAEIVLELVYRRFEGVEKVGAHIARDKARIDFKLDRSLAPDIAALSEQARELIGQDHPVVSAYSDERRRRRFWRIAGFAQVPCGGTHLRRTGEIGELELRRKNPGRGTERIEIRLKC